MKTTVIYITTDRFRHLGFRCVHLSLKQSHWNISMSHMFCLTHGPEYAHTSMFNTLRPRQNGRQFADDIFKCIFLNENVWIPIKISPIFLPKGPINNIPALLPIMAWRRPGDRPLSEPMMVSLPTHICVTRPQCLPWAWYPSSHRYHIANWYIGATIYISMRVGIWLISMDHRRSEFAFRWDLI